MRILFLDDMAARWHRFQMANIGRDLDWASDAKTAIEFLRTKHYDLICLDHDLIFEHYQGKCEHKDSLCGMAVAEFIAKHPRPFSRAEIHVHTLNDRHQRSMVDTLRRAGLRAWRRPFNL